MHACMHARTQVDLLQLITSNKPLQSDAQAYRSLISRLMQTLKVRAVPAFIDVPHLHMQRPGPALPAVCHVCFLRRNT